jgi:hypothetical protein
MSSKRTYQRQAASWEWVSNPQEILSSVAAMLGEKDTDYRAVFRAAFRNRFADGPFHTEDGLEISEQDWEDAVRTGLKALPSYITDAYVLAGPRY